MPDDALNALADVVRAGLGPPKEQLRSAIEGLFGSGNRYHSKDLEKTSVRDAYALATDEADGVPYAGFIHPDNASSGPYGGTSIVWFPIKAGDAGGTGQEAPPPAALMTFVVGTKGLSPDEGILTRPGHRRRIAALRRYLARLGVEAWTKPDPAALGVRVPDEVERRFPGFGKAFKRYGHEMYCIAAVPNDQPKARQVVQAFLDLYARERGWQVVKTAAPEYDAFQGRLRADIFRMLDATSVNALLRNRRFVVLQGPPGTGKTRMAEEIRVRHFDMSRTRARPPPLSRTRWPSSTVSRTSSSSTRPRTRSTCCQATPTSSPRTRTSFASGCATSCCRSSTSTCGRGSWDRQPRSFTPSATRSRTR